MRLIVGLGNPGDKYKKNRHNAGFMVVDRFFGRSKWERSKNAKASYCWRQLKDERIELFKPEAFMNNSGYSIAYAYKKHPELKLNDLYVIHDDLDITLGEYKIQKSKGPRLHRGVASIEKALGTTNFWRIRVGIDNRSSERRIVGEKYVLEDFTEKELGILDKVIDKIIKDIKDRLGT